MFNWLTKIKHTVVKEPTPVNKNWRKGMWVVTEVGDIGILQSVTSDAEVHLVDHLTGETVEIQSYPLNSLRQATWNQIPKKRRGISPEEGKALGYGS